LNVSYLRERLPPQVSTACARSAVWPALAGLAVIVAHVPMFVHRLLDGDEAIYGSIAVLMNLGGALYGDGGVDNKPPGIFWVYSLTFRVFGAYSTEAVHAVAFAAMAATCLLLYVVARDLAGARAGVLAALFYGLLTAAGNPRLLAANTEIFMMLPLAASVLFTLRRRWTWAAVLLAFAFAFRQSAAVNAAVMLFAVWWLEPASRRWRALGAAAGGGIAALVACGVVMALTGSLDGFWRWTIATLTGYASGNWVPSLVWARARDSIVPFVLDMAVLWLAALACAARWKTAGAGVRIMVVWLAAAMVGSLAGGHLSWHYFIQVMGPLAVLAAIAFTGFRLRRAVAVAAVAGIAVPVVAWWAFDLTADPLTYDFAPPVPAHATVAAYIESHTAPGDRVFVWGDWAALYVESDRTMASRFPGFLRGFARGTAIPPDNWDTAPDVWPLLASDLAAHPPALIVDTAPADWSDFAQYPMTDYPTLADFVRAGYHQVATVDRVVIYARNG
jgi:4-amino-4-deoxy-L-arabinose transferase-like glycosyltransferase